MKRTRGGDRAGRLGAEMDSHRDRETTSIDDWFANQQKNAKARPLIALRKPKKRAGGCDVCGKVSAGVGAGGCGGPGRDGKRGYSFTWCSAKHRKELEPRIDACKRATQGIAAPAPKTSPRRISASGPMTWKKMPLSEYQRELAGAGIAHGLDKLAGGDRRARDRVDSHGKPGSPASAKGPNRRRASQLLVRLTEKERAEVMLAAGEESHNVSYWIRRTLLGAAKKGLTENRSGDDGLSRMQFDDDELGVLRAAAEWQDLELHVWARELLLQAAQKTVEFK